VSEPLEGAPPQVRRGSLGIVMALASSFGFALIPIFALYAYRGGIGVSTLLFIRFALAAALLFGYLAVTRKPVKQALPAWPSLALLGAFYTMQSAFYFTAVRHIPAALASLILYSYPAFVCLLALLFEREKPSVRIIAALGVSLAGVTFVLGTSFGSASLIGVLYALGASAVYSFYITVANRTLRRVEPFTAMACISLVSSACFAVLGAVLRSLDFRFLPATWLPILALIGISTLGAIFAFFRSITLIGPNKTAIVSMTEPLFTIGLSALLFAERLTLKQALGGALVLTGTVLITADARRRC